MGSRILTDGLIAAFGDRVQQSTEVWLALAWVTASESLDSLIASGCVVRALVGTHGNATDPGCLREMIKRLGPDSLRIVRGDGPLFHPKLYLFRRNGDATAAWIGSANFTGAGLAANREILLDSDDACVVAQLEGWFDEEWKALRNQDVALEAAAYQQRRRRMGVDSLRAVVEAVAPSTKSMGRVLRLQFIPAPGRAARQYSGKGVMWSSDGAERGEPYRTAVHALCIVLNELQKSDESFLNRCVEHRAFREHHRDGTTSMFLARSSEKGKMAEERKRAGELGPRYKKHAKGIYPDEILDGDWLVSRDIGPPKAWRMIRAACGIGKVTLVGEGGKCGL